MQLYNSLTARKEPFEIPTDRPVTLYVCGVTPYDTTHMGHARTYLVFDVLLRYLRWKGAEVRYCQNVTDVDDPLFERATRDGVNWYDLAVQQVEQYRMDSAAMNVLPPTYFPRASEEIPSMIAIIERLIELKHAYVREGNVYYNIHSDPNFGRMAHTGYDNLLAIANQRGNNPNDPLKHDPLDFVLWQTGKPGDPTWDSPWGKGRPGWHIECSAMATRYLGNRIDIHGGGRDLIFPHHSCEIAQTEPATGERPFVQIWMHTGLVWLGEAKMSKSLGNLVFVRDALKTFDADTLRMYLLTVSYRKDFSYDEAGIVFTRQRVDRLRRALAAPSGDGAVLELTELRSEFDEHMSNNLRTPYALHTLEEAADTILLAATEGRQVQQAQATLRELAGVLGLQLA